MKIFQVIYSLKQGGAERFVVELSNELSRQGHDVTVCTFRDNPEDTDMNFNKQFLHKNVRHHNFRLSAGFSPDKVRKIHLFLKKEQPRIVHCHLNVIPYFFYDAIRYPRIRFYHTLHTLAQYTVKGKLQYHLNHFFYSKNKITPITISKICQQSYCDFYKLNNVLCIYNGSTAAAISTYAPLVKKEIESYKKNPDDKVFIHVARFHPLKNQSLLIDAFNKLADEGYPFLLLVIGNDFDQPEAIKIVKKSSSNIHFLGLKNNVQDYLSCSDAFCLSSSWEGLPISLLEALSYGCVPICTAVGGITDIIQNEVTGYLSEEISSQSYYETLKLYLSQPEKIKKRTLQSYYRSSFTMETCADNYIRLFSGNTVKKHEK